MEMVARPRFPQRSPQRKVIPHLRRAVALLDELKQAAGDSANAPEGGS
jgi:hypothetical protein